MGFETEAFVRGGRMLRVIVLGFILVGMGRVRFLSKVGAAGIERVLSFIVSLW